LRRQIGIVPQETTLFSGTIAQNIAFGQAQFDLKDVQEAAEIANAHQFITQFSQGYHTWVGERGVNLSGGKDNELRSRVLSSSTPASSSLMKPPLP
jgi:ATP-binding cassette subfamily B protein